MLPQQQIQVGETNIFTTQAREAVRQRHEHPNRETLDSINFPPAPLVDLQAETAARTQAIANEATARANAIAAESTARNNAIAAERTDRQAEIATERNRINIIDGRVTDAGSSIGNNAISISQLQFLVSQLQLEMSLFEGITSIQVYESLDDIEEPNSQVIYWVGESHPLQFYMWVEEHWKGFGDVDIDLTDYVHVDDIGVTVAPQSHVGATGNVHGIAGGTDATAGFSQANFTQAEKTKLLGIQDGATAGGDGSISGTFKSMIYDELINVDDFNNMTTPGSYRIDFPIALNQPPSVQYRGTLDVELIKNVGEYGDYIKQTLNAYYYENHSMCTRFFIPAFSFWSPWEFPLSRHDIETISFLQLRSNARLIRPRLAARDIDLNTHANATTPGTYELVGNPTNLPLGMTPGSFYLLHVSNIIAVRGAQLQELEVVSPTSKTVQTWKRSRVNITDWTPWQLHGGASDSSELDFDNPIVIDNLHELGLLMTTLTPGQYVIRGSSDYPLITGGTGGNLTTTPPLNNANGVLVVGNVPPIDGSVWNFSTTLKCDAFNAQGFSMWELIFYIDETAWDSDWNVTEHGITYIQACRVGVVGSSIFFSQTGINSLYPTTINGGNTTAVTTEGLIRNTIRASLTVANNSNHITNFNIGNAVLPGSHQLNTTQIIANGPPTLLTGTLQRTLDVRTLPSSVIEQTLTIMRTATPAVHEIWTRIRHNASTWTPWAPITSVLAATGTNFSFLISGTQDSHSRWDIYRQGNICTLIFHRSWPNPLHWIWPLGIMNIPAGLRPTRHVVGYVCIGEGRDHPQEYPSEIVLAHIDPWGEVISNHLSPGNPMNSRFNMVAGVMTYSLV